MTTDTTATTATTDAAATPGSFFRSADPGEGPGWLRLHLNESPYGPPAGTAEAVSEEADSHLPHYPDSEYTAVREALAAHFGVTPDMVLPGNGVDELVLLTSLTFLREPGARVALTESTFPGYAASAAAVGATVSTLPLRDRAVPVADLADALRDGADLAFVCNPLNPTGSVLGAEDVRQLLAAREESPGVLVLDEAYLDFAGPEHEHGLAAVRAGADALVLRTFSKAWGLASVRIGCLIGPPELVARCARTAGALPFRVSRPAQRAVLRAVAEPGHLERVRDQTARAREHLVKNLEAIGVPASPSHANFVMADVPGDSARVAARLASEHQVLVRDLSPLGLPGSLRITVGTPHQVERCVAALAAVLGVEPRAGAEVTLPQPPFQLLTEAQEAVLSAWLDDYISAPHPELGREDAVCPFVRPAIRAGALRKVRCHVGPDDGLSRMETLVHRAMDVFETTPPTTRNASLDSLIVVFDGLTRETWPLVDEVHGVMKDISVERGLMLGQMHPECEAPASRNPLFPVNRSPLPLIAVRRMAFHDILFLYHRPDWFAQYRKRFGHHYTAPSKVDPVFLQLFDLGALLAAGGSLV
ncbi:histidinol-phosphate aminotransferase family protein [Streptomyces sp. AJS327]|uniref:pyridoxal phosphate-dependent aminotransferase n=1 Tax=Streptomyces sp. AJS327 TaxID=2545265 RepID=UPI0015DFD143|nr:histidinol-phosphate transaminase [Streptomyces sp. AJS327]MBA0053326.1 histidinol-phosphate aminotransferase family protein [Streptomyces sp. AJS327]